MIWTEIKIKSTPESEEAISNILYEAGADGVVIESPNDLSILKNKEVLWDYIDDDLLNMDPEVAIIKGYINETENVKEAIAHIKNRIDQLPSFGLNTGNVETTITEVDQDDWENSWKQYYKPTLIGKHFIIKPSWEPYTSQDGDMVIEMDPGMAFGSGLHETTQLCMINLEKHVKEEDVVFDIGCGSGILSLAAANLNCKKVIGVDVDPLAVQVAKENAVHNHLDKIIDVRQGNLLDVVDEKADVIVANILAEIIIKLADQIKPCLKDNGIFISSGIILSKVELVVDGLLSNGFEILEVQRMGEWAAIMAQYKG